jgi:hypothetical protein
MTMEKLPDGFRLRVIDFRGNSISGARCPIAVGDEPPMATPSSLREVV